MKKLEDDSEELLTLTEIANFLITNRRPNFQDASLASASRRNMIAKRRTGRHILRSIGEYLASQWPKKNSYAQKSAL